MVYLSRGSLCLNRDYKGKWLTSPIQIKISKFEGSYTTAEASSQSLRKAEAQALEDRGSEIPAARNNLKAPN